TVLIGTGAGLCFPAVMALAMSSATPQDAGIASGLVNSTAQIGGALGLAALTDGYHLAFWIACALVVAAAALGAAILRPQRTRQSAPQSARELIPAGQAN